MSLDVRKFLAQFDDYVPYVPNRVVNRSRRKKKAKWETEREVEQAEDKEFVPKGELLPDIQSGVYRGGSHGCTKQNM